MAATLCFNDSFFLNSYPQTSPFRMHTADNRGTMILLADSRQTSGDMFPEQDARVADGKISVLPSIKAGMVLLVAVVWILMGFPFT